MLLKQIRIALVPFIGCLVCWAALLYPSFHARYLLYESKGIQVDRSTFEDAQRFAKKIGAAPWGECTHVACRWYKCTDNALLPRWYRGKGTTLTVIFEVNDSLVTDKGVEYSVGVQPFSVDEAYIGRPRVYVSETESWFKWRREKQRVLQRKFPDRFSDYVEPTISKGWEKIWYDQNGKLRLTILLLRYRRGLKRA